MKKKEEWWTKQEIVPIRNESFHPPCRIQNPLINYTRMYGACERVCLRACWRARWGEKMREARISGRVASFILLIKHRATELGVINWRVGCTRPTPRFFPRNNFSKRSRFPGGWEKGPPRPRKLIATRARFTAMNWMDYSAGFFTWSTQRRSFQLARLCK